MKNTVVQLSHGIKNIYQNNVFQQHIAYTLEKKILQQLLLKVCEFFFRESEKNLNIL